MSRKRGFTKSKTMLESHKTAKYIPVYECRVCLQAVERSGGLQMLGPWIEKWKSDSFTIAQDFEKVTNIQISSTDNLSKFICNNCLMKLKACLMFIQTAKHSDDILHKRYKASTIASSPKPIWPKPIQIDKVIGSDHLEVEVKQEVLSDDENVMETEDLDNEELRMDIKVEPEEYQYKEIPIHGIYSQGSIINVNGDQHIDNNNVDVEIKEEPLSEQDDAEMAPDMPLECMLCMKTFNSVSGLKAHVIAQHSYVTIDRKKESKKQLFSCTTCKRNFVTNTDLIVHETCHYTHACYMCNNKFDTFAQLTKHRKKCPKNTKCVTRVKTLDDVKRPSPEPQQKIEDKGSKQSQSVQENNQIDSTNTELEIPIDINNSIESNTMEIDNEQQTFEIEKTKGNDPEDQVLEQERLVPHSSQSENNPNIELHASETETKAVQTNSNNHTLESNNSVENSNLEFNTSQADINNTNVESNEIEVTSKASSMELFSNEDNNVLESLIPITELKSVESDSTLEINGDFEQDDVVKTTVVIGRSNYSTVIFKSQLHVEPNSPNPECVECNTESSLDKETCVHSKSDSPYPETNCPLTESNSPHQETNSPLPESNSPHPETNSLFPETNSPHPETNSPHPETNSPDTEITSPHPKSESTGLKVDSYLEESESQKPDLESNNSAELNLQLSESNASIELSSDLPESANENKPENSEDDDSTPKEDSDMKIHLEIHSLEKKVSIEKEGEGRIDTVKLNEDNILQ